MKNQQIIRFEMLKPKIYWSKVLGCWKCSVWRKSSLEI